MAGGSDNPGNRTVVVSAPGKVLLAGGYIVLDRKHTGLVFGLSARIHVLAQEIHTSAGVHLREIVVQSPQFLNATWKYGYHLAENGGGIKVTQLQSGTPVDQNHFVETTLSYVLSYISQVDKTRAAHGFEPASLLVLADNDYYSKPKEPTTTTTTTSSSNQTSPHPRFLHFGTTLRDAHKTGLGSSAAIVTALTASLLAHYLPPHLFDLSTPAGRRALHNLAQVAHCAAQGKVGSGFDVASAVYGSSVYRRFSPALLAALPGPGEDGFAEKLVGLVDGEGWDCEVRKEGVGLPEGVAVRMCDVDCGTQTVSMVKKVHAWREGNAEVAAGVYEQLQGKVDELTEVLGEGRVGEIGRVMKPFRELMRTMGRECGAPIEPDSQEEMLDALEGVEGVLGSVVPGAGGYDAAAVVMRDDEETEKRVKAFLREWSKEHEIQVRLMGVRGETEGARMEDPSEFKLWTQ
ncbi:ribosomal protein S5 domain 2-type protein [Chaetomium tenue]|uniref:Ribosomal protein S5 domain 2-type protein n=1 Tax=Chaetomium tenue TaxID=1854479 RepID=A0ACB7P7R4_9PEZI|nr:ribosomal protein S5 domain 2-type protein [Chaetomium globosum]